METKNRLVGRETNISNIMLVEAIRQMKEKDNPETRNVVIDETVMRAKFLMPMHITKEGKLEIRMLTNKNKENFFLAFTDWQEANMYSKDISQKCMIMTFDDYAMLMDKNLQASGFVINPFTANLTFRTDYIKELFAKKVEILTDSIKNK